MRQSHAFSLLLILIAFPAALSQTEVSIGPARPESPKKVVFNIVQFEDAVALEHAAANGEQLASFPLEKLNGYQIVLEQGDTKFVSSPIMVYDSQGSCTIANVPPGWYKLKFSLFKMQCLFHIPARPVNEVIVEMKIGASGIVISIRNSK